MTEGIVLALVIVCVCAALVLLDVIVYVLRSGKSALYTKNGSPVNVDQIREQRQKELDVWQAASPRAERPAERAERERLTRIARFGVSPPVRRIK